MSLHTERFVVIDLESTGLNVDEDRIVQVGLVDVPDVTRPDVKTITVNPGVHIPDEAAAIHGITNQIAIRDGALPGQVIEHVETVLYSAWAAGLPVMVYNAPYDLTLFDRECRRHLGRPFEIAGPVIDVLVLINALTAFKRGHNLGRACEHFTIPLPQAHDAGQDGLATSRLFWRLCTMPVKATITPYDRGEGQQDPLWEPDKRTTSHHPEPVEQTGRNEVIELAEIPLDHLMRAQSRWFRYSVDGFRENQRSKGREPQNLNWEWPMITKMEAV